MIGPCNHPGIGGGLANIKRLDRSMDEAIDAQLLYMKNSPKKTKSPRSKKAPEAHSNMQALLPYLGPCKQPSTYEEKLIEHINETFLLAGSFEFESGVFEVAEILRRRRVRPESERGQRILRIFAEHASDEMYGDFYRWADCSCCAKRFKPGCSLDYVNAVLAHRVRCPACSGKTPRLALPKKTTSAS